MKKRILFVDDERPVLDSLRRLLRRQCAAWDMTFLEHAAPAWAHLLEKNTDVVVTDVRMPGTSGLDLLRQMQESPRTKDIPVIVLTGVSDHALKRQALDLGATDLLSKPIELEDLLARLRSALRLKAYQDELRAHSEFLEQEVAERTEQLSYSRLDIIWRLGKAAEYRDDQTANHVIRVGYISRAIAEALDCDRRFVETLFLAAPLHDIGKIGISDGILLKRGRLSLQEWARMQQHSVIGANILRQDSPMRDALLNWRGTASCWATGDYDNPFLEMAASIAMSHHEHWDGEGYPEGLAGEAIPVEARIVALADAFDAMTSRRCYKEAYPEETALDIIQAEASMQFDPRVVAAFFRALEEIRPIRERFADPLPEPSVLEESLDESDFVCR